MDACFATQRFAVETASYAPVQLQTAASVVQAVVLVAGLHAWQSLPFCVPLA
jgi:hypothetical protein